MWCARSAHTNWSRFVCLCLVCVLPGQPSAHNPRKVNVVYIPRRASVGRLALMRSLRKTGLTRTQAGTARHHACARSGRFAGVFALKILFIIATWPGRASATRCEPLWSAGCARAATANNTRQKNLYKLQTNSTGDNQKNNPRHTNCGALQFVLLLSTQRNNFACVWRIYIRLRFVCDLAICTHAP